MEASENVEVSDLDSVSILSDKSEENDKISKTTNLDDSYTTDEQELQFKNDSDESFVIVNNVDGNDTDTGHDKNITNESVVEVPNDLCSNASVEHLDKSMDEKHSVGGDEEKGQITNHMDVPVTINDSLELVEPTDINDDDDNLLEEIHRGEFKSSSSEEGLSQRDTCTQSVDDLSEVLEIESHKMDEEEEEEEQSAEEEEQSQEEGNSVDDEPIEIDDDDDEEEEEEEDENEREPNENDSEDMDYDTDDDEEDNDPDEDEDDGDVKSVSVSDDSDVELIAKEPDVKKHILPKGKSVNLLFRQRMKKRSIRCLTSPKRKLRMHLEQSNATIKAVTEHSNGNNICQSFPPLGVTRTKSTDKTKDVEEMVQMLPSDNDLLEMDDSDDVCVIEDSPVKFNGRCEKEDDERMVVEPNVKEEQIEEIEKKEREIIEENIKKEKEPDELVRDEVMLNEEVQTNGDGEDDLASNKSILISMECTAYVNVDVPKTTDLSTSEIVPIIQDVTEEAKDEVRVNETKPNNKRSRSATPTEDVQPTKRLRTELEQSYVGHNKLLQDYIDKTSNNNADEIKNHVDNLLAEVQELDDMATAKEEEWNNILHLKKVKEEIIHRLTRKKVIMEIMSTKVGEVEDYTILEQQPSLSQKITKENRNSLLMSNVSNNNSNSNVPSVSIAGTEAAKSVINRAAMNTLDLAKEKANTAKIHRNILPKPEHSGRSSPNIVNFMTSLAATNLQHIQQQQKAQQQLIDQQQQQQILQQNFQQQKNNAALTELLNGHHQTQIGRQGAIKDVKSIIEDFRQKNPESIPRRGRRLKGINSDGTVSSSRSGLNTEGILSRQSVESRMSELGLLLTKMDGSSRPSSAESSPGNSNLATNTNNNNSTANANVSFNDMLMQYAKINERLSTPSDLLTSTPILKQQTGYPEVTLHPVISQSNTTLHQSDSSQANSLLHGILTKNTRPTSAYNSFSPTLARLLTAPERINTLPNNYRLPSTPTTHLQSKSSGINLTKPRSEITITPVMSSPANIHQTILQQQLQRHHDSRMKLAMIDDEADDSADRLVIDEGEMHNEQNVAIGGREFHENEVPECQGCKKREAQFVCAGCGNQWYCSRICQVSAWDEHSEVCTG